MGLFTNRKKKKEIKAAKIDDAFNRVYSQIEDIDTWNNKKLEHYILDSCEQIIASTKELERQKTEYRIVTQYLNDIKAIENMPKEDAKILKNTASKIVELEENLTTAKDIERNITDEQFQVISSDEQDMPEIINRYIDNEILQSKLKRNLSYLEGEKSRWEIEREELSGQAKMFKKMAFVIMFSFIFLLFLLYVMFYYAKNSSISIWAYIVLFICAASGFIVFLRQNAIVKGNRAAIVHLNQAISVLNVERMKYVNVTNAIEYSKDKYHVKTAAELQYVWEQYQDKIRDQQRYIQNNYDLEFYNDKLERMLKDIGLNDDKIWINQVNALIDRQDMAECRHRLVMRRKKIRDRIDDHRRIVQEERDEIDRLMNEHEHYLPEIQDIIKSVDKLCGTTPKASKVN